MFFTLNGRRGFFIPRIIKTEELDLYIGGHPEKRNFGNVVLGNFEVYCNDSSMLTSNDILPNEIIEGLQYDMNTRI